ncbi:MAG: ABC transporter substrate-binding protein [Acidipropionibacterium sp.]|nr:ABC transporter substrate-binding protein [Acidipropionibacterium sp.]
MRRITPLVALSISGVMLLSACGQDVAAPNESSSSTASAATGPAKDGGTVSIRGCTPQNPLIPSDTNETCGGNVLDAVTAKLVHYNSDTAAPELDIAQSIDTTDNQHFTVKLNPGYKFSDGTEVKAKNFVDGWNWAAYGPNAQQNSYFFEPITGYKDVQCGDDDCKVKPKATTMSGLKVVDDHTFTIDTSEKVSNLKIRLGYTAFAPLPDSFLKAPTDKKWQKFPVGAGPFTITQNTATQIVFKKNPDYGGKFKPHVDEVTYKIYNDAAPAYNDVVANNLDVTDLIPTDQLTNDQWKSDLQNRWGIRQSGVFQSITASSKDKQLQNQDLLKALSMDIDRPTITKQIFAGSRTPADGWVSPVVDGYKPGVCGDLCKYDKTKAKEMYDKAGGYKGTLTIAVNGDGDHKAWSQAVCNGWKNDLGLNCQLKITPDFKTLRDQITKRELTGFFRTGWQMDYPSIENFLTPLYATGASSNDGDYSNKAFDAKLQEAAAAPDEEQANKVYQEAEAMLAEKMPAIPLWYVSTPFAWSTKVTNVKLTPFGTIDLTAISVK